jgi:carbon storage regulator
MIMLVLTRRIGEEIIIADNIRVTVLAIRGGQIKLGLSAPPSVHVVRAELVAADAGTKPSPRLRPHPRAKLELQRSIFERPTRESTWPQTR